MVEYDVIESVLVPHLQKNVRMTINGNQYRKGVFKLIKYYGGYIEIILVDNGRVRTVQFPIPFKVGSKGNNTILSFKLEDFSRFESDITNKIVNCFTNRAAKYFNNEVVFEWCV